MSSENKKSIVIITGAGASFDLVPKDMRRGHTNKDYLPPLSIDLFRHSQAFSNVLNKYPKAKSLASLIKTRIKRGENLERILRELENSPNKQVQKQVLNIPLYIQELMGEVSHHYTNMPINYSYLIQATLQNGFDKSYFITLNYDTFLEKSLTDAFGTSFENMESYVDDYGDWMLLKLHGSVNWGRPLRKFTLSDTQDHEEYLKIIDSTGRKDIADEIYLLDSHQNRFHDKTPYYPAILPPVEGKYTYMCPKHHTEKFERMLSKVRNYLIIGTSAQDQDLTDLLKENIGVVDNLMLIGGQNAEKTLQSFKKKVPQFLKAKQVTFIDSGFSTGVEDGVIDEFLGSIA